MGSRNKSLCGEYATFDLFGHHVGATEYAFVCLSITEVYFLQANALTLLASWLVS